MRRKTERAGFEPAVGFDPHAALAKCRSDATTNKSASTSEHSAQQLTALGQQFDQTCDSEKLLALASEVPPIEHSYKEPFPSLEMTSEHVRIALAQDEAFNFYYPDTLNLLRLAGEELVPFSPLHDSVLPENIAGIYIGGGFPEEYAHRLSANERAARRSAN